MRCFFSPFLRNGKKLISHKYLNLSFTEVNPVGSKLKIVIWVGNLGRPINITLA